MKLPEIIGVSGPGSAGQDVLAKYLAKNFDFKVVSTSDMVRAAAMHRYGDIERETLQKVGPELRAEGGAGVLVARALKQPRPIAITGIRTLGELKELKKAGGYLLFVDAEPKLRYERMLKRGRDLEVEKSFEEFMEITGREYFAGPDDADFNLRDIKKSADLLLENNGTVEEFLDQAIQKIAELA